MKSAFSIFFALFFSLFAHSQNGINYKALIKDVNGNVLASSPISIQFIIYEGAALTNNVYQESHTINTDSNGFVMVHIGDGTTSGNFNTINWGNDEHFLNVQANIGSGLIDLGTTQFMSVPYAKNAEKADNVTGLEALDEGNGIGYRIIGRDITNYGPIGENAVDLTISNSNSDDYGATGTNSFAVGYKAKASGHGSISLGRLSRAASINTIAIGEFSEALGVAAYAFGFGARTEMDESMSIGIQTLTRGYKSLALGYKTLTRSYAETAIGTFNSDYSPISNYLWNDNDRLFVIGNGVDEDNRSNALTILKNGDVGIGTENPQELLHLQGTLRIGDETIRDAGNNALRINAALIPDFDDTNVLGNPTQRWRTLYAVNGTINTSDRREKKNIHDLGYGLNEVLQMKPISFNWKNTNNPDLKLGLIAQDLQALIPEVVKSHAWEADEVTGQLTKKELDRLGVYYSDLVPVLIKAIQEQQSIIDSQNNRINNIEAKLNVLIEEKKAS
ncbi:cell wall surface anchor family protein [Flavobacteriales bacterium ALC-1]|nr:cell wall surface anchor family protein [Flavobacteriales bacterium ALC-1]